jgi:hypothetical protein
MLFKTLYYSMPLFWTLAEAMVLVAVRWGLATLKGQRMRHDLLLSFLCGLIIAMGIIRFEGEWFLGHLFGLSDKMHIALYKTLYWNFFCTIWVILEGVIMVYVVRIYRTIRPLYDKQVKKVSRRTGFPSGIHLVIFLVLGLYMIYEYNVVKIALNHRVEISGIVALSAFFVRICGVLWILFEGFVALIGLKTYLLLKRV